MITVREAVEVLKDSADEIQLGYSDSIVGAFNWKDPISLEAFGNYLVSRIMVGLSRDSFELELAVQAMKVGEKGDIMLTPKYPGV